MRKHLRRYLPDHQSISENRWLRPFRSSLLHPRLWHLNRRSAAGAIACGLFCGLIPGPFQMLGAALAAVVLRVNLPLALLLTLYTNPLTIVPLYVLAFEIGNQLVGNGHAFTPPPEMSDLHLREWVLALIDWMGSLGKPLAIGLLSLASLLAVSGYLLTHLVWRAYLIRHWHRRRQRTAVR